MSCLHVTFDGANFDLFHTMFDLQATFTALLFDAQASLYFRRDVPLHVSHTTDTRYPLRGDSGNSIPNIRQTSSHWLGSLP